MRGNFCPLCLLGSEFTTACYWTKPVALQLFLAHGPVYLIFEFNHGFVLFITFYLSLFCFLSLVQVGPAGLELTASFSVFYCHVHMYPHLQVYLKFWKVQKWNTVVVLSGEIRKESKLGVVSKNHFNLVCNILSFKGDCRNIFIKWFKIHISIQWNKMIKMKNEGKYFINAYCFMFLSF